MSPDHEVPAVRTLRRRFTDPAEIGECFGDRIQYLPLRCGSYRLDVEAVRTPTIALEWFSHHGEVIVEEGACGWQRFPVFGRGHCDLSVDGESARPSSIAAATVEPCVGRVRGRSSYALVIVDGRWADTGGRGLRHIDERPEQDARLRTLLAEVRHLTRQDTSCAAPLLAAVESVADALHAVVDGVDPVPASDPDLARHIVAEAIAVMRDGQASSIADVTRSVAASRSSLYRSFESILGVSPYVYMQRRRLIRLRRRLLEVDDEPGMVTREAANIGAYHLGNLAKSYRDMFGELPRDTVKRRISSARLDDAAISAEVG